MKYKVRILRILSCVLLILMVCSCREKKTAADLIIYNAKIYTVDSSFTISEAMAVKDGRVLKTGSTRDIMREYSAPVVEDLQEKFIYPGLIDAHCHFLSYGLGLGRADLAGTRSFDEALERVVAFARRTHEDGGQPELKATTPVNRWIIGRGWDQNDWTDGGASTMPDNRKLDSIFPDRPVMLTRIDGHAALVNSVTLKLARITSATKVAGGEIVMRGQKLSGILIDNAVDLVKQVIPPVSREEKIQALLNAQTDCIAEGLTTVDDAGLMKDDIDLIDSLQKAGTLKIRIYAMLSDSAPNFEYYFNRGPYKTERLNVRSFKFYADGALGSRGACLYKEYNDKPAWKGFLLSPHTHFGNYAAELSKRGFQMNTHCIGDSATGMILNVYKKYCRGDGDKRWRVEHAQVVAVTDLDLFNRDIIPSVQPVHATSDMYWAHSRLGTERAATAYAYADLLADAEIVALGTDFPVEHISPFRTFYAAVARKDLKGFPAEGFQTRNSLTREQALRGMTIWAAWANFEENEKGSLLPGKFADFVVLDRDIMTVPINEVVNTKVISVFINGEKLK